MGPPRMLVVDNDVDLLSSLSRFLALRLDGPVEVATASSGDEARRRIAQGERFLLVLTDEQMPGLSGSELLTWLRAERPETARMLMSSRSREQVAGARPALGIAEAFIPKPFDPLALLATLRGLLGPPGTPRGGLPTRRHGS